MLPKNDLSRKRPIDVISTSATSQDTPHHPWKRQGLFTTLPLIQCQVYWRDAWIATSTSLCL
jgi:hypothetical protein